MQIASISNAYGPNPLDSPLQQADPTGQDLPAAAQAAQYDYAGLVSSPRASLTASATAVMSQSVDDASSQINVLGQAAAFQSYMNTQGLYGYQATLGAPLVG